jgi:hypothetical protein
MEYGIVALEDANNALSSEAQSLFTELYGELSRRCRSNRIVSIISAVRFYQKQPCGESTKINLIPSTKPYPGNDSAVVRAYRPNIGFDLTIN